MRQSYIGVLEAADPLLRINNDYLEGLGLLEAALSAGVIPSYEKYADAVQALADVRNESMESLDNQIEKTTFEMELFDTATSAISSDFRGLVTGTQSWNDALVNMESALVNAITQLLVIGPLMAGLKGLLPGGEGFVAGVLGSFQARADGGPVSAGRPYVVGERGPEVFVPATSGTIQANGASVVNVNIDFSGNVSGEGLRQSAAQIAGQIGAQTQRALSRNG